jgi:hypothetical protein
MHWHKSPQRARQFRPVIVTGIFIAGMTAAICGFFMLPKVQAQPSASRESLKTPTEFGKQLCYPMPDLRLQCLDKDMLGDKIKRGAVGFYRGNAEFESGYEYPVTNYRTVGDILKKENLLKSTKKRQIRVIQKDAIFQSPIDNAITPGFSPEVLQQKLNAGDFIIVMAIPQPQE